jgi:hypothetical protein
MKHLVAAAVFAVLASACTAAESEAPATPAAESAASLAAAPAASVTQTAPALSAYVGKYPFDEVNGVAFIDHPDVRRALEMSGAPAEALALARDRDQVVVPIFRTETALVATGYDPRTGGSINWNLAITPDGEHAVVCYQSEPIGHMYENGRRTHPVEPRCASDAESANEQLFEWPST